MKVIGLILLSHWLLLAIHRIVNDITPNLLWLSHLGLLVAALGFLFRNNLLLSGALLSIIVGHLIWIFDLLSLLLFNVTVNYSSYFLQLPLTWKLLTIHHFYLVPLLVYFGWKKYHPQAWKIAAGLYLFSSLLALGVSREFNINCVHYACPELLRLFPLWQYLPQSGFLYFFLNQLFALVFLSLIPHFLLRKLFSLFS